MLKLCLSGEFFRFPLGLVCSPEGADNEEGGGDADAGVSDVEGRPGVLTDVEVEEIGYGAQQDAVGEIAENAACEQSKGNSRKIVQPMLGFLRQGIADQENNDCRKRDRREPDEE